MTLSQKPEDGLDTIVSINIQRIPNIEYHESSNSCPDCDIERVMEVVADAGEGNQEGQAQEARLRQN